MKIIALGLLLSNLSLWIKSSPREDCQSPSSLHKQRTLVLSEKPPSIARRGGGGLREEEEEEEGSPDQDNLSNEMRGGRGGGIS